MFYVKIDKKKNEYITSSVQLLNKQLNNKKIRLFLQFTKNFQIRKKLFALDSMLKLCTLIATVQIRVMQKLKYPDSDKSLHHVIQISNATVFEQPVNKHVFEGGRNNWPSQNTL